MYKQFEIDFTKVKTIKDIVILLKAMELIVGYDTTNCPEKFKELLEKKTFKRN